MQDQTPMAQTDTPEAPADQADQQGTPIDVAISTVEQFMADPKSITPETLGQLRMDLEDLKTVLDQEEGPGEPAAPPSSGGLAGMIGGQ